MRAMNIALALLVSAGVLAAPAAGQLHLAQQDVTQPDDLQVLPEQPDGERFDRRDVDPFDQRTERFDRGMDRFNDRLDRGMDRFDRRPGVDRFDAPAFDRFGRQEAERFEPRGERFQQPRRFVDPGRASDFPPPARDFPPPSRFREPARQFDFPPPSRQLQPAPREPMDFAPRQRPLVPPSFDPGRDVEPFDDRSPDRQR